MVDISHEIKFVLAIIKKQSFMYFLLKLYSKGIFKFYFKRCGKMSSKLELNILRWVKCYWSWS